MSKEKSVNKYGGATFSSDGSAVASGSLEALKELLSGLEYSRKQNMKKGEDVVSITLIHDNDGDDNGR